MDGQELDLDSRPSDAIALAIRFDAPIYVAAAVLEEAGIVSDPKVAETPEAPQTMHAVPTPEPASDDSRLTSLEKQLTAAGAAEDYERAARLRDEITRLKG